MKKATYLQFLMLLIAVNFVNAQISGPNTFPNSGNVGIGTLIPSEKLDVRGKVKANSAEFTNAPTGVHNFSNNEERIIASTVFSGGALMNPNTGSRTMNFFDFPQSNMNDVPRVWFSIMDRDHQDRLRFWADEGEESQFTIYNKNQAERFVINENNNNAYLTMPAQNSYVMIGTNTYTDNGENYKLNVNGKVRALGVKVYTDWADYVFKKDYDLPTLREVEQHILEKGHLKDIPNEKEVLQNGIELGEMNKLLLQKIEELTLYLIEKDKQYKTLKNEVEELKNKIKQ